MQPIRANKYTVNASFMTTIYKNGNMAVAYSKAMSILFGKRIGVEIEKRG